MKKKNNKIIIIVIIIIIILIFITIYRSKKNCEIFTGGGYNLIFNTNCKENIEPMDICIACDPDSYDDLPIPKREGYKFSGWYYDKILTKKVTKKSTFYINPITEKDWRGCPIGYQDVVLYAKWERI